MRQLEHKETSFKKHDLQIVIVCDTLQSPENIGMILRIADGFGVQKVLFKSRNKQITKRAKRISRSAWEKIDFEFITSINESINEYKRSDYRIIAVELTDESIDLRSFSSKSIKKMVIVVGSESHGIGNDVLNQCDDAVMIPLFGVGSSLNVGNALSISLFEMIRQSTS